MKKLKILLLTVIMLCSLTACTELETTTGTNSGTSNSTTINDMFQDVIDSAIGSIDTKFDLSSIPDYSGKPVVIVNNNKPFFTESEITTESFEEYSELDYLGRCGVATACLSKDTMPAEGEERGEIGMIKPAGWYTVKYPEVISDLYLYNRCHLIGWQLCAENDNRRNLTTGTRYLNVEGMLPYENMVDDYIEETGNHVMYRVTPVFVDMELVCRGILIEAQSVEDDGCVFCIYCYNVQPGIGIDYRTGESVQLPIDNSDIDESTEPTKYILNNGSKKVHREDCKYAAEISENNYEAYYGTLKEILDEGFNACGACKPE